MQRAQRRIRTVPEDAPGHLELDATSKSSNAARWSIHGGLVWLARRDYEDRDGSGAVTSASLRLRAAKLSPLCTRLTLSSVVLAMATGCLLKDFGPMPPETGGTGNAGKAGSAGYANAGGGYSGSSSAWKSAGGATNIGGATTNIGGTTARGGTTGASIPAGSGVNIGGAATNIGGTVVSGGGAGPIGGAGTSITAGGGATGTSNVTATGDAASLGGALASGGVSATTADGAAGNGGVTGTFAKSTTGGTATGGAPSTTGGVAVTGGAPPMTSGTSTTGGTIATGGAPPTGGTTGGTIATGGAPPTGGTTATPPPSCVNLATQCQTESCCTTIKMDGGMFPMGRSTVSSASDYYPDASRYTEEIPEHNATVATFALDKYEVTVGRFRKFVDNYTMWRGAIVPNPQNGAGENPNVLDASNNRGATGWGRSWTTDASDLPIDSDTLKAALNPYASCNWTASASNGEAEAYPMNCVTWYTAFAFCIWDKGRLPTEAEWEYAAAGGKANRLYPWNSKEVDSTRANYGGSPTGSPKKVVGSYPAGEGVFGHQDLAGSIWEWVFDWYSDTYYGTTANPISCNDCANTTAITFIRVVRGGAWSDDAFGLRAAFRGGDKPGVRHGGFGFRCARTP